MRTLMQLPGRGLDLAIFRYGHLYVVQGRSISILTPEGDNTVVEVEFNPTTWASYGGNFCLYGDDGLIQLSGASIIYYSCAGGNYSAPYGVPFLNNKPLVGQVEFPGTEINGALVEYKDNDVIRFSTFNYETGDPISGVLAEPNSQVVFTKSKDRFGYYNGVKGKLLFGQPPEVVIPYNHGSTPVGGTPDGYVFSPDNGLSWRLRKLDGYGVITPKGIIQCSAENGAQLVKGKW